MPSYPLNTADKVIIDGSGNGTVKLGPIIAQTWNLANAAIRIPGAIKIPQCRIYMGATATDDNLIDATYSGALNATSLVSAFPLTQGKFIFAVWAGADVGATAWLSIYGTETSGNDRV